MISYASPSPLVLLSPLMLFFFQGGISALYSNSYGGLCLTVNTISLERLLAAVIVHVNVHEGSRELNAQCRYESCRCTSTYFPAKRLLHLSKQPTNFSSVYQHGEMPIGQGLCAPLVAKLSSEQHIPCRHLTGQLDSRACLPDSKWREWHVVVFISHLKCQDIQPMRAPYPQTKDRIGY